MSKAFTREPDGDDDEDDLAASVPPLPAGGKNYLTPQGHARLDAELQHLWKVERPRIVETVAWAASNGDRSENGDYLYGKKRLREIDRRLRFLSKRLEIAEVVDPAAREPTDRVYFGATVTLCDEAGERRTLAIVGVDETDAERGRIAWISPVARALIGAREGDTVVVQTPEGRRTFDIEAVAYRAISD